MAAPSGTPISAPSTTADRLTISDSRTIANSAGSAASTSCRAEAFSGMAADPFGRMLHFVPTMVNFRSLLHILAG